MMKNQLPRLKTIELWDPGTIEFKNELYTIYDCSERNGDYKVDVLKEFIEDTMTFIDQTIEVKIFKKKANALELTKLLAVESNTVVICAIDGSGFRYDLWKHSTRLFSSVKNTHWIDLRSTGDELVWARNPQDQKEYDETEPLFADMGLEDKSCQLQADLANNLTKGGNRIVAYVGLEMLLNINRGIENELYKIWNVSKRSGT